MIAVVSFAEPERLAVYQERHEWPFLVLADPAREAYRRFELRRLPWYRVFSPATLRMYFELLRRGRKIQTYGKDDYSQSGGDFILDREGQLLWAYRSHDPSDRPSATRLLEEVERIKAQK